MKHWCPCHWHVSFLSNYLFSGQKWANCPTRTTSLEKNPQIKCIQRRAVRLDRSNWYSTQISWFHVVCWSFSRGRLRWLWTCRQVRRQDFTRENFAPQPLGWPDEFPLCFVFLTFSLAIYVMASCPRNRMLEKKSSQVFYLVLTVYFVFTMSWL